MATTELTRDGSKKVKDACQEIMTREDEALAHRLQDEEFQTHYIRNRQERSTARIDVKAAKHTYLEEVKQAGLLRKAELQRLAEDDAWLATELQQRLNEEEDLEMQQRVASEMQDEAYAEFLQEREKERVKRERQRRLQRRLDRERQELEKIERAKQVEVEPNNDHSSHNGMPNADLQRRKTLEEDHPDVSEWTVDLSTKQEAANDSRSSTADAQKVVLEERSHQQELDDEELARRLQRREEEKLRKLMEERDRKLALKMQRKETEEYRREQAERQSRKSRRENGSEAIERDITHPRSNSQRDERSAEMGCQEHNRCDPSTHYYEEPIIHRKKSAGRSSFEDRRQFNDVREVAHETRPDSSSIRSRSKTDTTVYETIEPPALSKKDSAVDWDSGEKIERNRLQTSGDTPQRMPPDVGAQGEDKHNYSNVAVSLDPTFRGKVEEPPPDEDRIWAIGDSGIKVSSASKPAPLIQNTKRKQSKHGKDKQNCKQQ